MTTSQPPSPGGFFVGGFFVGDFYGQFCDRSVGAGLLSSFLCVGLAGRLIWSAALTE
jgi:hypothetical protein